MKVWVCETWEVEEYDTFGERITIWRNKEDAVRHGQREADVRTTKYAKGRFRVWEAVVQ